MMMVTAGRQKDGLFPIALRDFKAKDALIKSERSLELGDLEMDVSNARAGCNGRIGFSHGPNLTEVAPGSNRSREERFRVAGWGGAGRGAPGMTWTTHRVI